MCDAGLYDGLEVVNVDFPRFRDVRGNERPVLSDRQVTTHRGHAQK
jgi:uncharacterized protein (DUF934 family)